jgi:hypothetical protein
LVVFLLLATTTYFIVTKGFDYVKKILLDILQKNYLKPNGEVPTEIRVTIETPKVLRRIDLTKSFLKNGLQLVKEMQSCL